MKCTLFLVLFSLPFIALKAQTSPDSYNTRWRKVDSLMQKRGLVQSAQAEISRIYELALKERNEAQQIRALVYKIGLNNEKYDDAIPASIKELDSIIGITTSIPARSILQGLEASLYQRYYQQNQWKFYRRSATTNFVKKDIATWSADDFTKKIEQLYQASLKDQTQLEKIALDQYSPIILKGNVPRLRPTLFDLLAHQALDYYVSGESAAAKPENAFELDDPALFNNAGAFVQYRFSSTDSISLNYKAVLLFQRLIRLHLSDTHPDALIDVDIERLSYMYQNSTIDNKDRSYVQALQTLTSRWGTKSTAAQAWYLLAAFYAEKAEPASNDDGETGTQPLNLSSDPIQDSIKQGKVRALAICQQVLQEKDSSEGWFHCQQLAKDLQAQRLKLTVEKVNVPGKPFRSLVAWSNFSHLFLRILNVDKTSNTKDADESDSAYWHRLLTSPVYRSFTQELPVTTDYRQHSTEIAIGSLPPGAYAMIGSSDAAFSPKSPVVVQYFYVSSIAFIHHDQQFFVLNRETGHPIPNANVQAWGNRYNSSKGRFELVKKDSYRTDESGHFQIKPLKINEDFYETKLEITIPGDRLFIKDDNETLTTYTTERQKIDTTNWETKHKEIFFFLDRSIYRPGQTVYFKGIVVTNDLATGDTKIMPGQPSIVYLYNTNNEIVDSLSLTTNEYGSYHSNFRLPEHQLNGRFEIREKNSNSSADFFVEEYKRPKFFVEYEKPRGGYRVGDSIQVTGNAKGYAGNSIDGAKVSYRVVRTARFLHPWLFRRIGPRNSASQEIAHGTLTTDAKGNWQVSFLAKPDRSVSASSDPQFDYQIYADVTDLNGETRSTSTRVVAAYKMLNLGISIPNGDHLPSDSLKTIALSSTNLSDEPVNTSVQVSIYSLQAPDRLIRSREWAAPDLYAIPEKQFIDSFPNDQYRQELQKDTWSRGSKIWETTDSVKGKTVLSLPAGRLTSGWYLIEAITKDKYGQEIKDLHYAECIDGKSGRPANPQYDWAITENQTAEPGQKVHIRTGSSASDVFVIRRTRHAGTRSSNTFGDDTETSKTSFYRLDKGAYTLESTLAEADRGGFGIVDVFIRDNRIYQHHASVDVPWTNKQLKIDYSTYRDKTQPGSAEKWQVKISGYKGEQVSAELLTAMYDASLDQFEAQSWNAPDLNPIYSGFPSEWMGNGNFGILNSLQRQVSDLTYHYFVKVYDQLIDENLRSYGVSRVYYYKVPGYSAAGLGNDDIIYRNEVRVRIRGTNSLAAPAPMMAKADFSGMQEDVLKKVPSEAISYLADSDAVRNKTGTQTGAPGASPEVQIRKNFAETAFFFPDLHTDASGNVSFSFTMPEALTQWKWMLLAHTKELAFASDEKTIVTQKKLMVMPNAPRFLREGDRMELPVKISNLTDSEMTGQVSLQLTDPTTGLTADGQFTNRQPNQYFTIGAGQSAIVSFPLDIPYQYNKPLTYKIVAQASSYSDGEEATLPVVSNRMLVTEALPLNISGDGIKHFSFEKLLKSGSSETLNHHALTVEFTSNPAWYAVEALPYLAEFPYECAEQTFNRYYANALASKILGASPRLRQVFDTWRTADTAAFLSNLQKNEELKSILLEETPWVVAGKSEAQQKKNIALLFDLVKLDGELRSTLDKVRAKQSSDGGFAWFKGGNDDRYITQYILTGIAHLQQLKAIPASSTEQISTIVTAGLGYLDAEFARDYKRALEDDKRAAKAKTKPSPWISQLDIQYLYMRSLLTERGIPGNVFPAVNYFRKKLKDIWIQQSTYMQAMSALALYRTGDVQTAKEIMTSLKEKAIHNEERGMYWKGMEGGYYWYQAPVETAALMIEAFREIVGDAGIDRELKTWLLKQKQTQSWPTTKSTADACFALLSGNEDWLDQQRSVTVTLGDKQVSWDGTSGEAGTGYYKKSWDGPFVNPGMGNITVDMKTTVATPTSASITGLAGTSTPTTSSNATSTSTPTGAKGNSSASPKSGSPAWGAVYWQYFDMLDHITPPSDGKAPLRLAKKLFLEKTTTSGKVLEPVEENATLKPGDRVIVRIELSSDRDMEYVHMKDMRAACMEPENVISQYKWQGGLGYYESTKDASTDFFFSTLPKGTFLFEYPVLVGQSGNFSNGITTIECMYAPEFTYHSEGIRINVEAGN